MNITLLLLLVSFSSWAVTPKGKIVNTHHDFSWKIFKSVAQKNDNVFISPASLYIVLSLCFEASQGETRQQGMKFLGISPDQKGDLHPPLLEEIKALTKQKTVEFRMANAVWTDSAPGNEMGIKPPAPKFTKLAHSVYEAEVAPLKFKPTTEAAGFINKWVENHTNKLIKDFINPGMLENVHMALVNAVYFKGTWKEQFDAAFTRGDIFFASPSDKVKTDFMIKRETFSYLQDKDLQMVDIPYKDSDLAMTMILPSKESNLPAMIAKLDQAVLKNRFHSMKPEEIVLHIPKFTVTWGTMNLTSALEKMGMPVNGDFSDLGHKELKIQEVVHKAFIKVDEVGTEAAAVSAALMRAGSMPTPKPEFFANRPFLYIIRNVKSGDWLFMGQMTRPEE